MKGHGKNTSCKPTRWAAGRVEEILAYSDPGKGLRVWLDDDFEDRAAPEGWYQVDSVADVILLLQSGRVVELSLDYDLGDDESNGVGVQVIDWLAEQQTLNRRPLWPRNGLTLHTANPYGRDTMSRMIRRYASEVYEVQEKTVAGKRHFTFRDLP